VALQALGVVDDLTVELHVAFELRQSRLGFLGRRAGEPVMVVVDDEVAQLLTAGDRLLGLDLVAEPGLGCA